MAHRSIGQDCLAFSGAEGRTSSLDEIAALIAWQPIVDMLAPLYSAPKGEAAWPPLAMFRGLLLAVWYDLSDVKLAEALDDRASFRRFCGFSAHEPTPERTAFVRFRRLLVFRSIEQPLFDAITTQLKARAIRIKTCTIVDATIIASQTEHDDEARWVKHKGRSAVHGFKAHVGADASTSLVEKIDVTPANVNDGRAGPGAVPEDPGEVFADSAYRGPTSATRSERRAAPSVSPRPPCGAAMKRRRWPGSKPGPMPFTALADGSRRSSALGSAAMASAACDGAGSPRPPSRSTSPPSPTISNERSTSSPHRHDPPRSAAATEIALTGAKSRALTIPCGRAPRS